MEVVCGAYKQNPISFCRRVLTPSSRNEFLRHAKRRSHVNPLLMVSDVFYASVRTTIPVLSGLRETSLKA